MGRSDLVDLQEAVDLAAFVLLLLHLLRESLPLALLNGVGILEGPASPPVRLPHIVTGVAAPGQGAGFIIASCKSKVFSFTFFTELSHDSSEIKETEHPAVTESVPVRAGVLLEVVALGPVAALTPVGVQFAGVKHLSVIGGSQLCTKHTKQNPTRSNLLSVFPEETGAVANLMWPEKTSKSKSNHWQCE